MSPSGPTYPYPYLGEIRIFAARTISINVGWHLCDGSLLSIEANQALYSLIGTTYGGDGVESFALPDLRSRVPVHQGGNLAVGTMDGAETVILNQNELPTHTYTVSSSKSVALESPAGNFWGVTNSNPYASPPGNISLNPASVSKYGFGYAHENRVPYMVINFMIALVGKVPTEE